MPWWKRVMMAVEQINPDATDGLELTEREQLIYACINMNGRAKREMRVVGTPQLKTPWDLRHEEINNYLTLLELT
jgi:hypothetical protein